MLALQCFFTFNHLRFSRFLLVNKIDSTMFFLVGQGVRVFRKLRILSVKEIFDIFCGDAFAKPHAIFRDTKLRTSFTHLSGCNL